MNACNLLFVFIRKSFWFSTIMSCKTLGISANIITLYMNKLLRGLEVILVCFTIFFSNIINFRNWNNKSLWRSIDLLCWQGSLKMVFLWKDYTHAYLDWIQFQLLLLKCWSVFAHVYHHVNCKLLQEIWIPKVTNLKFDKLNNIHLIDRIMSLSIIILKFKLSNDHHIRHLERPTSNFFLCNVPNKLLHFLHHFTSHIFSIFCYHYSLLPLLLFSSGCAIKYELLIIMNSQFFRFVECIVYITFTFKQEEQLITWCLKINFLVHPQLLEISCIKQK